MTSQEQRIAALETEIATLQASYERLTAVLIKAGEHAGIDLTPPPVSPPEGATVYVLPDRRDTRKRAAGGVSRATPHGVPCRASTPGRTA